MKGKHILLMLVHLFRKCGSSIEIDEAVYQLAFKWRYGPPTNIRRLLTVAQENELISINGRYIKAEFLYDLQELNPNQADTLSKQSAISSTVDPLY